MFEDYTKTERIVISVIGISLVLFITMQLFFAIIFI